MRRIIRRVQATGAVPGPAPSEPAADDWTRADPPMPEGKRLVSLRIDADVLEWYRRQGKGYQTRMNAVLRAFMEARKGRHDA